MGDVAIRVRDLVKEYDVYKKPLDLAVEVLTRRKRHTTFRALDGISLEVGRGEVLGIIGSNGAGKSTLLKIVAGVLDATGGSVEIYGRVTAILELGLGFNPEYSGRENIYLSGLLYGMEKAEVDRKIDGIIGFSGLREFIERPVKTYSSGMHSRLAFSIATAVDPDILIIDEALAAGDAAFVQKCLRRIRELCSGGRTVLLVSHGTGQLAQLCQRVVWMERGQARMIGPAIQVVQAYDLAAHQGADEASWIETIDDSLDRLANDGEHESQECNVSSLALPCTVILSATRDPDAFSHGGGEVGRQVFRRGPVFIESVELLDRRSRPTTRLTLLEPFTLKIYYRVEGPLPKQTLGVALAVNNRHDLAPIAQFMTQNIRPFETRDSYERAADRFKPAQRGVLTLLFSHTCFRKGDYLLSLGLLPNEPATWEFYEYRHFFYSFSVDDAGMDVGAPVLLTPILRHAPVKQIDPTLVSSMAASPTDMSSECSTLRDEIEAICVKYGGYPDAWPHHDLCPACGQGPLVPAFAKYGFNHMRCGACSFVCLNPHPPKVVMDRLYSGAYYTQIRELYERRLFERGGGATRYSAPREMLESIVDRVAPQSSSGSWLDVGGGIGAFAALVRQLRPNWRVHLNEYNPSSVTIAQQLFNLEIVSGDAATLAHNGARYDVVSSVAVLEHVPEPLLFLEGYADLVKPGGWLVTVIPHFTPLNGSVSHGSSPNVVPPYHVSLFQELALRRLLERLRGWQIVSVDQAGPAAFELIHHVDFGDNWDITIPTQLHPEPRSLQVKPYDSRTVQVLDVLSAADARMGSFFAETDGRLYLAAYCRKGCDDETI